MTSPKNRIVKAQHLNRKLWPKDLRKFSEYNIWCAMRQRCQCPTDVHYRLYGARGITVSNSWEKFENFLGDMGFRPTKNHSIDRINNDKGYSKENCRWATKVEQVLNTRQTNKYGFPGVYFSGKKFLSRIRTAQTNYHLGSFDTPEEAGMMYAFAIQYFENYQGEPLQTCKVEGWNK